MPSPPDQILILTTQWRHDAIGRSGEASLCATPALVPFFETATRYSRAYTRHPFGPFARAAILTGQSSPQNGVRDYFDALPPGARTLAHDFRARGYQTAWIGKWHLSERDRHAALVGPVHARQIVPEARRGGFSFWEGFESGFLLNDPCLHGSDLAEPTVFPGYQADVLVERALRWWKTHEGQGPRFLVLSLENPHPPYAAEVPAGTPAVEWDLPVRVPRGGEIEAKARRELAGYTRHVGATAEALARFWSELGESGQRARVVLTSVHGDMHGSQGVFRKGWPYEESVRVPLWIHEPGQAEAREKQGPVSLIELGRAALGHEARTDWGEQDAAVPLSMPSVVNLPWQCPYQWSGYVTAREKYVETADGQPLFWFDLVADPGESHNLLSCATASDEVERCRARLAQVATGLA